MKPIQKISFLIALISLFFFSTPASAHRPDEGNDLGITPIQSPTTSFAYYRELTSADDLHFYSFEGQGGQFFHVGINIPQITGLENYGVTLALIGPGLPELNLDELPFDSNLTSGRLPTISDSNFTLAGIRGGTLGGIVASSSRGEDFYEPFTQTNYWGRQTVELDLPGTGIYYLIVWNPDGQPGKYVMDTGTEEVFGPGDLLLFPKWWLDTHIYFEHTPYILGSIMIFLVGLTGFILFRRRNQSERFKRYNESTT